MFKYILILALVAILVFIFKAISQRRQLSDSSSYKKINLDELKNMIENNPNLIILDVRTEKEHNNRNIPNSVLVESHKLKGNIEKIVEDKETPIVVYCESGGRSRASALTLLFLGYTEVYDFGSIRNWK